MTENHRLEEQRFNELYQACLTDGKLMFAGALLQRTAQQKPNNIALIEGDKELTYNELYQQAVKISKKLQQLGVMPRDRVFVLFENSIDFYRAYYGAWQIGAIVAPLNTFLKEQEFQHILADAKPKALLVSSKFAPLFNGQVPLLFTEKEIEKILQESPEFPLFEIAPMDPDELTVLLYTSGTTGFPKGVMLSSRNILINVMQDIARVGLVERGRILALLPLFHAISQNTCVWAAIFLGATVIIAPKIDRKHIREGLLKKPTAFLGVPALFGILCLMKNAPLDSVDFFISGGDALPDKIRAAFELIYGRKLCNGYGLTEAGPVVCVELDDSLMPTNTVGRPMVGIQVAIRDDEGKDLPQGQIGLLWVKGPNIMLGYYNEPELTKETIKDHWLNTGDFAYIDAKERIVLSGRHKDIIINKGIKIYPQEVENVLLSHKDVIGAAVIGKKMNDEEVPIAFVSVRTKSPTVEQELYELCKQNLADYKVPRQFTILDEMPLTSMGKIDKKLLRETYLTTKKD